MVNKMYKQTSLIIFTLFCGGIYPLLAADSADKNEMENHEHMNHDINMMDMKMGEKKSMSEQKSMDHSKMSPNLQNQMNHDDMGETQGMNTMPSRNMAPNKTMGGKMQGGSAPANARDPHAFSDGYDFGELSRPVLADEHNFASLLVDRLEVVSAADNKSAAYDLQFWYGLDYNRLVIKAEGDYDNQALEESSTDLLWSHALDAYWNSQLGLRYDSTEDANQSWLGFGVQGLSPYWFEIDISAYIGEQGRTALTIEAEYEVLLTQKLILQPRVEIELNGKNEEASGIGSGLSNTAAGVRLRYEIRRECAPYVGVEWAGKFGKTADYARTKNSDTSQTSVVAGVRFWF